MSLHNKKLLDDVGWQILVALQENARLSYAELGRQVGFSLPAVAERVRRMEEAGIITGYHAKVDPNKIGLPTTVFILLSTTSTQYPKIIALARDLPEVRECHHITGADSFIMKVLVSSIEHLEELTARLTIFGQTTTSIVLSSPEIKQVLLKDLSAGVSS